jgi:phage baseplate assembly protein W
MSTDRILGRGVRFPFRPGASGGFAFVEGEDDVAQAIRAILSTAVGERQMRFAFGSELPRTIFEPVSAATLSTIQQAARDALVAHEARITVRSVIAAPDPDVASKVDVTIEYEIRRTSRRGNLVFPFLLDPS